MNWTLTLPEMILAGAGLAILGLGVLPRRDPYPASTMAVIGAFLLAAIAVVIGPDGTAFAGQMRSDGFTRFMKLLALASAALALVLGGSWNRQEGLARFEYPILVLFATLGTLVLIGANDLMSLYMGLELLSLALYVLAAFARDDARSGEAGLKYFVLGALASGLMLYGMSLIYGFAGSTAFPAVAEAVRTPAEGKSMLTLGLVFLLAGFCFKLAAVPFHMWTPDVYEGAPTTVVAYLATAAKVGALAALLRLLAGPFAAGIGQWQHILLLCAAGSLVLGALAGLRQENIKRLLAYSWIGHAGFILLGVAAGGEAGWRSAILYLPIYVLMGLGAFAVVVAMRREGRAVENIADLAGLARTDLAMAVWMAIFMFSMAGIPPLAGFFAKLFVLRAAIDAGLIGLAVLAVLASVVSAFYYLRIVKVMFFDDPAPALARRSLGASFVMVASGLFNLLFVLWPVPLFAAVQTALTALLA